MKTAVVTDTNSGITAEMGRKLGVFVVPMPVIIDGKTFIMKEKILLRKLFFKVR